MELSSRSNPLAVLVPLLTTAVLVATPIGSAQQESPPSLKQLFESGKYQGIVDRQSAQGEAVADPLDDYFVAQAYLKLGNGDGARQVLAQLEQRGETDPWALIARAERARLDSNLDGALALAQTAVAQSPPAPAAAYAFYQLGAVHSQRQDMPAAADAFEKATAADPSLAYAHYYAALVYSRLHQIDRVALHLEAFLRLAPEAPERGAAESIMRTIQGR